MFRKNERNQGFTLIEILVSFFILTVGVLSFLYVQTAAMKARVISKNISTAVYLAEYKMSALLASNISNIDNGTSIINTNNVNYTIKWGVSKLDNVSNIKTTVIWNTYNKQHSVELVSGKRN